MRGRWLVAGLARWRDDRAVSLVVAGLVIASTLVVAPTPRLLQQVGDDALRSTVAAMPVGSRGIQLLEPARIAPDAADPLANVVRVGAELEARLPPAIRELVRGRSVVVDTPRYSVVAQGPRTLSVMTLRIEPGALERVRFTSGRAPTGAGAIPDQAIGDTRQVYEIALSETTAARIGAVLGDVLQLDPDTRDPAAMRFPVPAAARIVGLFRVSDPSDPAWFGDTTLATPGIRSYASSELQFVDAIGLLSPAAYARLMASTVEPWSPQIDWRLDIDPARITALPTDQLEADLRRLVAVPPVATDDPTATVGVRTDLGRVVAAHLARWRSAALILAVAALGTALVGLAALALVARLAARRRRQTVSFWLARGATRRQVAAASLLEAGIIVGPAAVLAATAAIGLSPGGGSPAGAVALAMLVAVAAAALLVTADLALIPPAPATAATGRVRRSRRPAIEASAVILALAGVVVLRGRDAPAASAPGVLGPDPFMAAVPALVGIAAGLVVVRGFRFPMRLLAGLAPRWRGMVPALAVRRATRGGASAAILLVLMATTTVATFAATTLAHLDEASAAIAWHDVGADLHVSVPTPAFPAGVDLARVPGVTAVAEVYRTSVPLGDHGASIELLAVDPAALDRVTAGTGADLRLGTDLAPSPATALPALVSSGLVGPPPAPSSSEALDLSIAGQRVVATAIAQVATVPTMSLDTPAFVVVSRPALEAILGRPLPTTDALVRAPGITAAAFRAAIAGQLPGAEVAGRAETETAIRHSPVVDAAAIGIVLAALTAAAYAAIALVAALALASGARAAETAHLRTLGLSMRQSVGLVVLEHLPAVATAFIAGALLGLVTFAVVEPGLGLDALLGSALRVPLDVDLAGALALLAATAVVVGGAMAVGAALETSAAAAPSIRRGIG